MLSTSNRVNNELTNAISITVPEIMLNSFWWFFSYKWTCSNDSMYHKTMYINRHIETRKISFEYFPSNHLRGQWSPQHNWLATHLTQDRLCNFSLCIITYDYRKRCLSGLDVLMRSCQQLPSLRIASLNFIQHRKAKLLAYAWKSIIGIRGDLY